MPPAVSAWVSEIFSWGTINLSVAFLSGLAVGLLVAHKARGPVSSWFAMLPGLICHELAHFLVATVTGSDPSPISLFPKRIKGGWELGSVRFSPGWSTAGFVALAPLYLLPPIAVLVVHEFAKAAAGEQALAGYVVATLIWGAWPSGPDWKIALRYPLGTFILGAIAALLTVHFLHQG